MVEQVGSGDNVLTGGDGTDTADYSAVSDVMIMNLATGVMSVSRRATRRRRGLIARVNLRKTRAFRRESENITFGASSCLTGAGTSSILHANKTPHMRATQGAASQ